MKLSKVQLQPVVLVRHTIVLLYGKEHYNFPLEPTENSCCNISKLIWAFFQSQANIQTQLWMQHLEQNIQI